MLPNSFRSGLGLLIFCALLSCGGGGGGNAGIDGSGAPAVAVVSGPINGFGSVIVNGVHYNTDNAEFWVRGVRASEAELNVGSYIHLEGTTNDDGSEGVAKLIYFQPNVIGAVSSVDLLAETFVVLGQTVHLTNDTALDFAFSPRDINGIRVGQQVEVSGPLNADGEVIATRVGLMLVQSPGKELAGPISDLDTASKTFRINNITVSFAKTSNLPELINGQRVILRGASVVNGVLQPNAIELEQKPQLPQGQLITQTGLITRFVSAKDFTLGNFDVITNSATVYERTKFSDLKLNVRATIVGRLQNGKLVADKISVFADVEWKIQGPITDIRNMTLAGGEIKVQGSWLKLTAATRVDSELSMAGDRMKFANLRINDFVVVTGHKEGGNQVVTSMEREDRPQLDIEKKILGFVQKAPLRDDATWFQLEPQVTVLLEEATQFYDNTTRISKEQFVQKAAGKFVAVFGVMIDDGGFNIYKANSIQIIPSPAPGGGKGPRPGDKISQPMPEPTVTAPVPPYNLDQDPMPTYGAGKPVNITAPKTEFRSKPEWQTKFPKPVPVDPPADTSSQSEASEAEPSVDESATENVGAEQILFAPQGSSSRPLPFHRPI
jgi:hypothetical protein